MFKKMCIIVQCVFQFVFPNVSSVLHCLLQLFLRTFVLHKLQTTLLCMDTLIHVRPSPFALTLSHVFTWENSHTQHLQPHQSQRTCALPVSVREKHAVPVRVRWVKGWITGTSCSAITVTVEFMRSEEKLRASLNRWLLLDSSLRLLEGESIRKTETEDMCQSVQTCLGIWEGREEGTRERETERKRERNTVRIFLLCCKLFLLMWTH